MPFTRRMMAAGAIVGLLIPVVWFAFYLAGSQIFIPRIFNPQWTDDVIYIVWPSFLMLLLINKSMLVVGPVSVFLNVILYALYGYIVAVVWSRSRS
jgi:hypothetical protein